MIYNDEQIMRRCFELARNGGGRVAPNPMVGAVIVYNGKIIGEGYHSHYGAPHAEVMAIESVTDKSLLSRSIIYVSLEPCCHYGKTPPCTQLILDKGIPKVVIAAADPFTKVNGCGIQLLKNNGVGVVTGVLENEARELNKFFYTYHEKKRPYIILKWAESVDGYIDSIRPANELPTKITNAMSSALVHRWRSQVQSIMVGTNTIIRDNPRLTVRNYQGNNPLRTIIDRKGKLPANALVFNNESETLLFIPQKSDIDYGKHTVQIEINFNDNVEEQILSELYKRQIQSLFIEGGTQLITNFSVKNLWDEARIFIGNVFLKNGVKAPQKPDISPIYVEIIGNDKLLVYRKNNL
ncbi:MAG: bifunctional diaminohydroxyphosphoribosylaminopyrimidine deaminase/5-amino-6-(5-phosphoribosylamino)uracil reductase RibD [Prevotellaceae bacterium]|jgi:diaminohydroxyphosphoribosylaminopyrimidine deaminase/5-amino-6-(5-phosphoribosylamino)uracil reductase|nr:bifunctional diaminohydroxyphosphoribosylaminopyrimidine deaminase/5-amino-6-(5-phosphoribosylamino)uracil reductase RibD [Prevotellaceae bacterium]